MAKLYLLDGKGNLIDTAENASDAKNRAMHYLKQGIHIVYVQESPTPTQWTPNALEIKSKLF